MAATFKYVSDTMRDLNITTWMISSPKRKNIGAQRDGKLPIDMSISRLRNALENQRGEYVTVTLDPPIGKGGDRKNTMMIDVDLSTLNAAVSGVGCPAPSGDFARLEKMIASLAEQNQKLQAALIESKYENQIKDLQQQIAGAHDTDPINRVLELVIPILGAYVPKMLNPDNPPAINGINPVDRLLAADPDGMKVIEKIAELAENKPDTYAMYKPMLMSI